MSEPVAPAPVAELIGLDLGKRNDWTALAIVQKRIQPAPLVDGETVPRLQGVYDVPFLDRVRGVSYELIADRVASLKRRPEHEQSTLVIDETGVGTAVGDMLETRKLKPHRVTITGGIQATHDGLNHHVPKRDLATTVAILLESHRLRIAEALALAKVLTTEMENFQATINLKTGHESFGAAEDWREGNHDDLVLAVALAVWMGERIKITKPVAAPSLYHESVWSGGGSSW